MCCKDRSSRHDSFHVFLFHFRLFLFHCVYLVQIITTFSTSYPVCSSRNSWIEIPPYSDGTSPHLFCYFCDICLGILGNVLSLVCPGIRECGSRPSGFFFFSFLSPNQHYFLNYILFPESYSLLSLFHWTSFVCALFEQWLWSWCLFLTGNPKNPS
jgi:hypothetical protein